MRTFQIGNCFIRGLRWTHNNVSPQPSGIVAVVSEKIQGKLCSNSSKDWLRQLRYVDLETGEVHDQFCASDARVKCMVNSEAFDHFRYVATI